MAVIAPEAREAMRQHAALEVGAQLLVDVAALARALDLAERFGDGVRADEEFASLAPSNRLRVKLQSTLASSRFSKERALMPTSEQSSSLPESLWAAVQRMVEGFHPRRIVLFGSHAWGHPGPDSDFDLLVLVRGVDDVRQLAGRIRGALRGIPAAFDIIVRDEDAWRKWANDPLTMEYHVEHDGKVLHDAG